MDKSFLIGSKLTNTRRLCLLLSFAFVCLNILRSSDKFICNNNRSVEISQRSVNVKRRFVRSIV